MTLNTLISGHAKFKDSFNENRRNWARLVAEGQHPYALRIDCSDSRVIPEKITGAAPGELFVMRNVANVVPPYGTSGDATTAVLEYAVIALGIEHIIVYGHTFCGGVRAVMEHGSVKTTSHIARWVSWIRPAFSQIEALGLPEEDRSLATVKENVLLQRRNVESYPDIRRALRTGQLSVHSWLFDLESGDLLAHDDATNTWQVIISPSDE